MANKTRKRLRAESHTNASTSVLAEIEAMYANYKLTQAEPKMQALDQLPKSVRQALTASQFNWDVVQLLQTYREKRMNARQLVLYITSEDRYRLRNR